MDLDKLKAYLGSRKQMNQGSILGAPVQTDSTPSFDEVQDMPDSLKQLVIKQQLMQNGLYSPGAGSKPDDQVNADMGMGNELLNQSQDDEDEKQYPFSSLKKKLGVSNE